MPAVQQAREHRTNAKTRRDGLYSMGFSWFDCEPQDHEQPSTKRKPSIRCVEPLPGDFFTTSKSKGVIQDLLQQPVTVADTPALDYFPVLRPRCRVRRDPHSRSRAAAVRSNKDQHIQAPE